MKFIFYKQGRADCAVACLLAEFVVLEAQKVGEWMWSAPHFGPGQSTFGGLDKLLGNIISIRNNVLRESESYHL